MVVCRSHYHHPLIDRHKSRPTSHCANLDHNGTAVLVFWGPAFVLAAVWRWHKQITKLETSFQRHPVATSIARLQSKSERKSQIGSVVSVVSHYRGCGQLLLPVKKLVNAHLWIHPKMSRASELSSFQISPFSMGRRVIDFIANHFPLHCCSWQLCVVVRILWSMGSNLPLM